MDPKSNVRRQSGFTVIEILAVIVIISILAAIISVIVAHRKAKARTAAAIAQIRTLEAGLEAFQTDHGFYPSTEQGLEALVQAPTSGRVPKDYPKGGYLAASKIPFDPWGTKYIYESPGSHGFDYEITSLGADAMAGGKDENTDIESWNLE